MPALAQGPPAAARGKIYTLKTIGSFISKYMVFFILAVAALALLAPRTCLWIRTGWINPQPNQQRDQCLLSRLIRICQPVDQHQYQLAD